MIVDTRIDFTGLRSKEAMLGMVARTLKFPRHFGMNLDALHDCLTDLSFKSAVKGGGHSITLVKLARTPGGEAVYAVFRTAARDWKKLGAQVTLARE